MDIAIPEVRCGPHIALRVYMSPEPLRPGRSSEADTLIMSLRGTQVDCGVCPTTLARKLALVRIERESKNHGGTHIYDGVLDDLHAAITERKDHEEAVDIVNHYADQLERRGKWEEMKRLYRRAMGDLGNNFGRHHSSTLAITFRMGRLLRRMRQPDMAQKLYSQSLEGMDDRNPYQLYFSNELGVAYADQYLLSEAEREFRKALRGFSKIGRPDHTWASTAAINLSDVYLTQGRLDDAAIMLRLGLLGVVKDHGAPHAVIVSKAPRFIKMYEEYVRQQRWDQARGVCEMALTTFEEVFGVHNKETLHVVWDLAQISKAQGQQRESQRLMKRAIEGLKG